MPGLSVPFKEFAKKPLIAVLYVLLLAIGGLYIDLRSTTSATIKDLKKEIVRLTVDGDLMRLQMRKADSSIADMTATLRVLKQVGKIN